jgi:hypothetical protein
LAGVKDGMVYDVPGCELGHHGEDAPFDAILKKCGLADLVRALSAQIVRAADSQPRQHPPSRQGSSVSPTPSVLLD